MAQEPLENEATLKEAQNGQGVPGDTADAEDSEDFDWEENQDRLRKTPSPQDEGAVWALLFGAVAVCIALSMLLAV